MTDSCPSSTTLSTWLDDELAATDSQAIRTHLEACAACRGQVLGWIHVVQDIEVPAARLPLRAPPQPVAPASSRQDAGATSGDCLSEEILVAYCEAELSPDASARAEQHLSACDRCVGEVQRLTALQVGIGETIARAAIQARPVEVTHWVGQLGDWLRSIAQILAQPWPMAGAIAATAALALVIARLLPSGSDVSDVQFRGVPAPSKVEVVADNVPAHAGPGDDEPIVATLGQGITATKLEESADWTRIELPDGGRVWVRSAHVRLIRTEAR